MRAGLERFPIEASAQISYLEGRSPAHARLLRAALALIESDVEVRQAVLAAWYGRTFHTPMERPLLLCAAIRFDALSDVSHPLARAVADEPEGDISPGPMRLAMLRPTMLAALRGRHVQTNEVTRACAWRVVTSLIPVAAPWVLADLGCSAALNLVADRVDLAWTDAAGAAIPVCDVRVAGRFGFDRAPIDPRNQEEATWLRACIWPGQSDRLRLFHAALRAAREAVSAGDLAIAACDAIDMPSRLEALSSKAARGARVIAYQTVMQDYLSRETRGRYRSGLEQWLVANTGRALWSELERDPDDPLRAQLRVHFAVAGVVQHVVLASCEYHPKALAFHPAASESLARAFA